MVSPVQADFKGGVYDVFVTKLGPAGDRLIYSTYLGGSGDEYGLGIAVDLFGQAYVTGGTTSPEFPTVNPFQAAIGGLSDAFITKLSSAGNSLLFSTFLGGSDNDYGFGIAVDLAQQAYVTGRTPSRDFPTVRALQPVARGFDAFVTKFQRDGAGVIYSTYLGGSNVDEARDVATDALGNAYVAGQTRSSDFPLESAVQSGFGGGISDAFVMELTPDGSHFSYSTYLGGRDNDDFTAIAVDILGNAYLTGTTTSVDYPTVHPFVPGYSGQFNDVVVTKLNSGRAGVEGSTTP
jgi:hypothetical protein